MLYDFLSFKKPSVTGMVRNISYNINKQYRLYPTFIFSDKKKPVPVQTPLGIKHGGRSVFPI